MSFGDKPSLTIGQKVGCLAYGLVAFIIVTNGLIFVSTGHCAPEYDGTSCEYDGLTKFIIFPGSLIASIVGGIFLVRYMMKDRG